MSVRIPFEVKEITAHSCDARLRTIKLRCLPVDANPENSESLSQVSGTIEILVADASVVDELQLGMTFYVDFSPFER